MVFIKATALLSLLAAVSAAPTNGGPFILRATWDSAMVPPFQNQLITASGNALWIGKPTASYCPDQIKQQKLCPAGKNTAIGLSGKEIYMSVTVPGGQRLYVDPSTGAVSFTQAHSASIPADAITTGFEVVSSRFGTGPQPKNLLVNTQGQFFACPTKKGAKVYQVFFDLRKKSIIDDKDVPSGSKKDCIYLAIVGEKVKESTSAWQYT
ncbi:hypothetical protein ABW20_dc0100738 [Dactylellina cionopaga]|nr:hypothetical protein ABW20_dc0100738 [Dactylellina cionopaga]